MDVTETSTNTLLIVENKLEDTDTPSEQNEQLSPECLQRKLYFLLEHLKKMHSELTE